jgi:predicted DNA-binding antitoxin AbrB/MazE fold protein
MTKHLRAIYENGVFRPLEPVALEEHQEVTLSVGYEPTDNLADIAIEFFGDQGVDLPPHPAVPVRPAPDFGA